jgi:hypothetical protein
VHVPFPSHTTPPFSEHDVPSAAFFHAHEPALHIGVVHAVLPGQSLAVKQATHLPSEQTGVSPEQAGPSSRQVPVASQVCGCPSEHRSAPKTHAPGATSVPASTPPSAPPSALVSAALICEAVPLDPEQPAPSATIDAKHPAPNKE